MTETSVIARTMQMVLLYATQNFPMNVIHTLPTETAIISWPMKSHEIDGMPLLRCLGDHSIGLLCMVEWRWSQDCGALCSSPPIPPPVYRFSGIAVFLA